MQERGATEQVEIRGVRALLDVDPAMTQGDVVPGPGEPGERLDVGVPQPPRASFLPPEPAVVPHQADEAGPAHHPQAHSPADGLRHTPDQTRRGGDERNQSQIGDAVEPPAQLAGLTAERLRPRAVRHLWDRPRGFSADPGLRHVRDPNGPALRAPPFGRRSRRRRATRDGLWVARWTAWFSRAP